MGAVVAYPPEFRDAMKRLMGLKFAPADLTTHWEALRDLALEDLDAAVARAQRECDEFPSPKMLRSFVALNAPRVVGPDEDRSQPITEPKVVPFPQAGRDLHVTREWHFYCDTCSDTGWASFTCGVNGHITCGSDTEHYQHEYVNRCACWYSNQAVVKRRERNAQQAHTRQSKRED